MKPENVLILPGWQNSGPEHWQSRWEATHGYRRVDQHDWMSPKRGDWIARLEDVLLGCDGPAVLVAHSLGCLLTAAWASHSQNTARVKAALLVAPGDAEREELQPLLPSWSPIPLGRLPFPSVLMGSRNDPYCSFERAQTFATAWGSRFVDLGDAGHINAETGLGDWPAGHAVLAGLFHL
ncbi:RBBP9/YdeN family alpha/beta hydrolase [Hydrogenophaga sp. BPS33]|uniref:RBBP9/YdeN family alpha/beta hydrolase n=1 Tax=Hydrogenophaga sp. BPS33 TaxID=2651974 RepID=UPI00131F8977|nr:alpha/beta hydrolase [Hydrogenophaga sp. BPS33]QHE83585.1 serine hydrolase family protein [Hydrogenophaga sp. BPS33]